MDDYFYQALMLSVLAVVLLQLVKLALRPAAPRLPPGPWELPIIGSMHHLVNVLPHRALRDLAARYGPLMLLRFGQIPLVVVSSKKTARAVLRTHDTNFATRPKLLAREIVGYEWVHILFAPSGEYWRKLRQLCAAEILSPKRVLSFHQTTLKDIHKTLDTIQQKIIDERKAIRDNKIKSGQTENVDENLVDVLIGLQEKGGFGFDLTNTIIKAIISYW
ncbi:hypothetical protein QOZ80_5AG0387650 [Eleusine coracana subsp. coracana]|nr:hypothetical protein QOZ80_5AG0387650 [Eleusine coracana subsp. coracana]